MVWLSGLTSKYLLNKYIGHCTLLDLMFSYFQSLPFLLVSFSKPLYVINPFKTYDKTSISHPYLPTYLLSNLYIIQTSQISFYAFHSLFDLWGIKLLTNFQKYFLKPVILLLSAIVHFLLELTYFLLDLIS